MKTVAKSRIQISLTPDIDTALAQAARHDSMPRATKATQLLRFALEIEEDHAFDEIAVRRDTARARFVSHTRAWK
ncbi:hypothetical protein HY413_01010 [Candidatus Kaiserbacteria bacterium]|nr:hypothetical protein [Candidatus Kaiserbacteria bacterium]